MARPSTTLYDEIDAVRREEPEAPVVRRRGRQTGRTPPALGDGPGHARGRNRVGGAGTT